MQESPVAGIFIADCQWHHRPPAVRSCEKDWMAVQERCIIQLRELQLTHNMAPIFIAGDLFDRWEAPPVLISSLIRWLYGMVIFSIPGNHDLPNHNYKELYRGAYWVLVEAGAIHHLIPGGTHTVGNLVIHPFPYSFEVVPPNKATDLCLHVALIHDYFWVEGRGHKDAPAEKRLGKWYKKLRGYDAVFAGDNHIPWWVKSSGEEMPTVVSCGTFMRRHSDEIDLAPSAWLLHTDGSVVRHKLDTSADVFLDLDKKITELEDSLAIDLAEFAEELTSLHNEKLDFSRCVLNWVKRDGVPDTVKTIILRCLGRSAHVSHR